jgi:PEP-CTERM motif-containing protein
MMRIQYATVIVLAGALCAVLASIATQVFADVPVPVTGWLHALPIAPPIMVSVDNIINANTNSPTIGNGTTANANNETVFGSLPSQHINPGQAITLTGQWQINRANISSGQVVPGRDVRLGLWDAVNPNAGPATGWLGYMANVAGGTTPGNLEVRNPDDPNFNNVSFISDQSGGSIATTAGPAPAGGSPLDGSGVGSGMGRYFRLAQANSDANMFLRYNTTYDFWLRVVRVNSGSYAIRASVTNYSSYTWNIGGCCDFVGLIPPANFGTAAFTSHLSADYDRVGFLFGAATGADSVNLTNVQVQVTNVPEPGTLTMLATGGLGAMLFRKRFA